jgi:hypothetical protein
MACMAGEIVASACMSLRSVEQSGNGRVKKMKDGKAGMSGSNLLPGWWALYSSVSYLREEN